MSWLVNLAWGNPITLLWIAGAIALGAGGAGWQLNGWRLGAQIADVKVELANANARVAILEPANDKCKADVADVRQAFAELKAAESKRAAAAKAAVAKAEIVAAANIETAKRIMAATKPPPGQECAAIMQEEADYVRQRQAR